MKNFIKAFYLLIFFTSFSVDVLAGDAMGSLLDDDFPSGGQVKELPDNWDADLIKSMGDAAPSVENTPNQAQEASSLAKDIMKAMEDEAEIQAIKDSMLIPGSQQSHALKVAISVAVGDVVSLNMAKFIADCADSAAHPNDPKKYGRGVEFSKIKTSSALRKCEIAYDLGGNRYGLVTTSLSRVHNKMENYQQAIKYAKEAVAVGYAYGDVLMAAYYYLGEGVEKNQATSTEWYEKAAKKGVSIAMTTLSEHYAKGIGTEKDFDKSLYWALKAVNLKNEKAFYDLGFVLEKMAEDKPNATQYYKLSKEAFEIADANFVDSKQDIAKINKKLHPNSIAETAVLFQPTIKGQIIGGVFISDETDLKWYGGGASLKEQDNEYLYARVSHQNSVFTLWYKHSPNNNNAGWYIDFFYAGSSQITNFKHVTVSPFGSFVKTGTSSMRLDAADLKLQELAGGYRLTAKISYRDALALQNGETVNIHFEHKGNSNQSYGLTLNEDETQSKQSAKNIIAKLIAKAKILQPACCQKPIITPVTKEYFVFYNECVQEGTDHSTRKQRIRQNCHHFLKNARSYNDVIMSNRLDRGISRYLQEVDMLAPTPKPDNKIDTNVGMPVSEDFIFSNSHQRLLKRDELVGLSKQTLRIARNEIFARHGRYFDSPDLQKHFDQYSWYKPHSWDVELNEVERENVNLINKVERN